MKSFFICAILLVTLPAAKSGHEYADVPFPFKPAANLFIITIDGFRWQEVFNGADETLISDTLYTQDTATMKMLYWSDNENERRKKLMPFFWNIIAAKGQLYGNRRLDNKVNTANFYATSYPGYNEMFTGNTDLFISSNKKKQNRNTNVLEYLDTKPEFRGKVVAFTSWDVFPYILNEKRNGIPVNSGYENNNDSSSAALTMIDRVQDEAIINRAGTRYDQLTFLAAKEYITQNRPRVMFLGLGEADEFAHHQRYDLYLQQAHKVDGMLAELWHWIQTTPGYKDNTSILITTDHGRGSKDAKWSSHNSLIKGSSQTWLAMMGPGIDALGEIKEEQQLYQQQVAGMIAELVGEKFDRKNIATAMK